MALSRHTSWQHMHWMHLTLSIVAILPAIVAAPVGHIFTHSAQAVQRLATTFGRTSVWRVTKRRIRLGSGFDILVMSERVDAAGGWKSGTATLRIFSPVTSMASRLPTPSPRSWQ
jgi:hypothetical protein